MTADACQAHLYKLSQVVITARAAERTAQNLAVIASEKTAHQDQKAAALSLISLGLSLTQQAEAVVNSAVAAARDRGCTWQDVGSLVGTTRQAAFQRFGRPLDPRTGASMLRVAVPHADSAALAMLAALTEGNWDQVTQSFNDTMALGLPDTILADNWASLIAQFGQVESCQTPIVRQRGQHTVVDIPVAFEAGDIVMRVSYEPGGRAAGLYFLDADLPSTDEDGV